MSVIGYIRVSSTKQSLEHQRFEIEQFVKAQGLKVNDWVEEKISSRKALKKRKLGTLLENIQENDILIACEISRLARSLLEVMRILETCLAKNCQVWTLKENYRLGNDIQSKVLAFAFGLAAEIERNLISQRTKSSCQPQSLRKKTWPTTRRRIPETQTVQKHQKNKKLISKRHLQIPNRQNPMRPTQHLETFY